MKTCKLLLAISFVSFFSLSGFSMLYPTGAPAGKTGSPGDGSSCTSCHGQAATTTAGLITSTIPVTGYVPGQTYQITAVATLGSSGKYGFEVSSQNASGTQLGTLVAGTGSKLVGGSKYVTHSSASTSVKTWTFGWIAPAAGTGEVTFYGAFARNYSGPTTLSTLTVQEAASTPAPSGPISGPAAVCINNNATYSVGTIAGATNYVWSVPSGATIVSGMGTTSISVSFSAAAASGNISVYGSNTNGNGASSNLPIIVNSIPVQSSAISGSTNPCQTTMQTYSVTNVPGLTYSWVVPSGSTINSGQGTNSINVIVGPNSGNVTVLPSNNCGNGPEAILGMTVNPVPAQPSSISGSNTPCLATSQVYSVTNVAGVNYAWSVPAGTIILSGQGTNSINATIGANNGNISVVPSNACGNGEISNFPISVGLPPSTPSVPSGPAMVNLQNTVSSNFTTSASADAYVWQLSPASAGTISGSGATSLVSWNNAFIGNAEIKVKDSNTCGESAWSPAKIVQVLNTTGIVEYASDIIVNSSQSAGHITLTLNTDANQAHVVLYDLTGRIILKTSIPGSGTQQLDHQLKAGVYIIAIEAGGSIFKKKIVVG